MICLAFLLLLLPSVLGGISQQCLDCICRQESGCRPLDCRMDGGSLSCGYFQIKKNYWIDCGMPGSGWKSCSKDKSCSERCVRAYMRNYGPSCTNNGTPTCEDYARIHNGGPTGCKKSSTLAYWRAIQRQGCTTNS